MLFNLIDYFPNNPLFEHMDKEDIARQFTLLLEEYKQCKAEQQKRISTRDFCIYLNLAALGLILGKMHELGELSFIMIPFASISLGWYYLNNDKKVSELGRYIKNDLEKRLQTLSPHEQPHFGWEHYHKKDKQLRLRKGFQLVIDWFTFPLPGILGLIFLAIGQYHHTFELDLPHITAGGIALLEAVLLLWIANRIWKYSGFSR